MLRFTYPQRTQFRGFVSSSRKMTESLWKEFFNDPSQFYDVRNLKKNHKLPDFRHKRTGKPLWIDGFCNPHWIREKLQRTELPCLKDDSIDRDAIIQLIKSCGNKKDITTLKTLHAEKGWISDDVTIANTLIRSYGKCGAVKEAQEVFDKLKERNVVSWSALIAGYAEQGFGEQALTCFREMQNDGMIPNSVAYACSLKACAIVGALDMVKEIHDHVRDQGLINLNIVLGNSLINAYAKCGAVKEACKVFDQLAKRNVESWNALIAGYVDQGFCEDALTFFTVMENDEVTPNAVTYACVLKACAIVGSLQIVERIHSYVRKQHLLNKDIVLGNSLVNAYAKCGALKESQEVFNQLAERNVVSWSALIDGYAEQGFGQEALECFRGMKNDRVAPNAVTYASCLKACAIVGGLEIVKEIHTRVREQGLLDKHIFLGNSLVQSYAKCGAMKEAREVIDQLPERDVVSWGVLIDGYAEQGFSEQAVTCFKEMKNDGIMPNAVTYACTLKACAMLGTLEIVEEIYLHIIDQGLLNKLVVLGTMLVNAFAKCGVMKEAREVFDQLTERNIECWTAVLTGYAQLGQVNDMLHLFNRMIVEGILPDPVIFLVLLNGCSHAALLVEGERLFYMIGTYGLDTSPEHYTCMVDLFGRAGRLDKAECFVLDHPSTLVTFLGACQKWVNVDLGRWAFEKLLQLDQNCVSAYVCMANIYAAAGMIKEAEEIKVKARKGHEQIYDRK